MSQLRLALPLAMTVATAPFAIDTYLPAFPDIAADLQISIHQVSLSASVYIAALALGQLLGGPVSDRYGRQLVMFVGLIVFTACSFLIGAVDQLNSLLTLRALQAFGGGCVLVCVPALVRDRAQGVEAARLFSLIGMIMVAAPAVAPAAGGALLHWGGWRSIFMFLGFYGLLIIPLAQLTLFPRQRPWHTAAPASALEQPRQDLLQRYLSVIRTPSAVRYILLQGMAFSVMMLFVTHSSFLYQQHFGVSAQTFSLLFAANIATMWFMMFLNRRLLNRCTPRGLLTSAVTLQFLGVSLLVLIALLDAPLWFFVPAMMLTIGATGATSPNCQACYMEHFSRNGGSAAALMGTVQFGLAGLISGLSTTLPESALAIVLAQLACSLAALTLAWWPARRAAAAQQ